MLEIKMNWTQTHISICVTDNGIGFESTEGMRGVGLWNVNQRVKQLKGEIQMGHPPIGSGAEICITIPLVL
jgi:signal transduction histidine kinase